MTIQDALERAKSLRRGQPQGGGQQELRNPRSRRVSSVGPLAPNLEEFETLPAVRIDRLIGRRQNIVTVQEAGGSATSADAAFRLLRSRLQHKMRANNWCVLAVTSPTPGDGKTTTSLNLACSIAREKQRTVFLLDLDMRNPSAARYFGVELEVGLDAYFRGQAEWNKCLYRTNVDGLVLAGCNSSTRDSSELLANSRLEELLAQIRRVSPSSIVIIDTPPVCATDEALMIGPRVDAVLVIVSEGKTPRTDLATTMGALAECNMAGLVINQSTEMSSSGYEAYY